jgi:hypothetical protein
MHCSWMESQVSFWGQSYVGNDATRNYEYLWMISIYLVVTSDSVGDMNHSNKRRSVHFCIIGYDVSSNLTTSEYVLF